jgi:hypothetical protein
MTTETPILINTGALARCREVHTLRSAVATASGRKPKFQNPKKLPLQILMSIHHQRGDPIEITVVPYRLKRFVRQAARRIIAFIVLHPRQLRNCGSSAPSQKLKDQRHVLCTVSSGIVSYQESERISGLRGEPVADPIKSSSNITGFVSNPSQQARDCIGPDGFQRPHCRRIGILSSHRNMSRIPVRPITQGLSHKHRFSFLRPERRNQKEDQNANFGHQKNAFPFHAPIIPKTNVLFN